MGELPKRVTQHEIDSEACKVVSMKFDRSWEVRDLTGRDFGIDKIVEKFENGIASGNILLLQIKGTENKIAEDNPRFSIPTKTLLYSELFSTPFLLIYCSLTNLDSCYYLWLQEYIEIKLNYENLNWRLNEETTVYFPANNKLATLEANRHIDSISKFPRSKDSWINYYLALENFNSDIDNMCHCISDVGIHNYDDTELEKQRLEDFLCNISIIKTRLETAQGRFEKLKDIWYDEGFFDRALLIISEIVKNDAFPESETVLELVRCCNLVNSSVAGIAQRFSNSYKRLMYESDGAALFKC